MPNNSIPTRISLTDFGKAMAQLDLTNVPKKLRPAYVMDHLMSIQADTILDSSQAAVILTAQRMHHQKHRGVDVKEIIH